MTETILEPLGLSSTTPDLPDDPSDHALGYPRWLPDRQRTPFEHVRARSMNSATGLSSTTSDLLRWYRAHRFGNGELLHDRTKREIVRFEPAEPPTMHEPSMLTVPRNDSLPGT